MKVIAMMDGNANFAKKFIMEQMKMEIDGYFVTHMMASIICSVQGFITRRNNIMKQTPRTNYFYVKNVNNKTEQLTEQGAKYVQR